MKLNDLLEQHLDRQLYPSNLPVLIKRITGELEKLRTAYVKERFEAAYKVECKVELAGSWYVLYLQQFDSETFHTGRPGPNMRLREMAIEALIRTPLKNLLTVSQGFKLHYQAEKSVMKHSTQSIGFGANGKASGSFYDGVKKLMLYDLHVKPEALTGYGTKHALRDLVAGAMTHQDITGVELMELHRGHLEVKDLGRG